MIIKTKKQSGFTLAELLVSFLLIGILAAILIPTILHTTPSNSRVMFKKAYSTLEKVIEEMINDDTNYPASETILLTDGITYQRNFNYVDETTNDSDNKFCFLLTNSMNTLGDVTIPGTDGTGLCTFRTADGIDWTVYIPISDDTSSSLEGSEPNDYADKPASVQFPICSDSNCYTTLITVDVNGDKDPNCSEDGLTYPDVDICDEDTKPDTFQMGVRYDGKINVPSTDSRAIEILSQPTTTIN